MIYLAVVCVVCAILALYFSSIVEAYDDLEFETIALKSSEYDYGDSMPWDDDVTTCDVLRDTDQDLYADAQNARHITLY